MIYPKRRDYRDFMGVCEDISKIASLKHDAVRGLRGGTIEQQRIEINKWLGQLVELKRSLHVIGRSLTGEHVRINKIEDDLKKRLTVLDDADTVSMEELEACGPLFSQVMGDE